jgi:hypothetical protein
MITAKFMFERETKGAIRYQEIDAAGEPLKQDQAQIGTLYVRKTALNGEKPAFIEITLKATEID